MKLIKTEGAPRPSRELHETNSELRCRAEGVTFRGRSSRANRAEDPFGFAVVGHIALTMHAVMSPSSGSAPNVITRRALGAGHQVVGEHRQEGDPGTDLAAILLGHHPRDLSDVDEIMHHHACQEVPERQPPPA